MSISTIATKDTYVGNASNSTPYPITFKYFDSDHVTVYADGVEISSGGLNYCTFGGDGSTGTGEFTTSLAYAATATITVVLDVPLDQPVVLQETGTLPAKTIEVEGFDRLNMQIRRVWRKLQDVLTYSNDEGGTGSTGTADSLLGFDSSGDIEEVAKSTFLATANNLSDVTAATARTNLNVDVAGTDNSTNVTAAGSGTYVSISGASQILTVDPIEGTEIISTGQSVGWVLQADGDNTCSWVELVGGGNALKANPLSQFAQTTSLELKNTISDETGSGSLVFSVSPVFTTPNLGTPSSLDLANATGTPTSLNLANATGTPTSIDLTNATNTPLPAAGTVTEAMLNTSTNLSLDKADGSLQVANNLSDVTAATARTNLGLVIGTDVQAYSSTLANIVTLPSVTGTATFTNATNNIQLTGIGDLSGLAVGDVIQITGSVSNNKLFTVSSRTNSDNIIVNVRHAGVTADATAEGNKALVGEVAATSVTATLYCKAKDAPIGLGMGYVTTTFGAAVQTNTTGRTIVYSAYVVSGSTGLDGKVNGVTIQQAKADTTGVNSSMTLIIPDGCDFERGAGSGVGSQRILS